MIKFLKNQPLSQHTTFKIGGEAEYFYQANTQANLIEAIKQAREQKLNITIIGNGSNLLVSDQGVKGLVLKNSTNSISINQTSTNTKKQPKLSPRFIAIEPSIQEIEELEYNEESYSSVLVSLDSGVTLPKAIFSLLAQGITGLEWFAGIPATIGGACFINLHGGKKYFSDYLVKAKIITPDNQIKTVSSDYFKFDYDSSALKNNSDIVLEVTLKLLRGPKETALKIAKGWALKKSHQPQRSAGCIFQNLSASQQKELRLSTPSIGYLIDKVLGLKGHQIGQAKISLKHAGFIENLSNASSQDVVELIQLIQATAKSKLNLKLKLEIVPLGFDVKTERLIL